MLSKKNSSVAAQEEAFPASSTERTRQKYPVLVKSEDPGCQETAPEAVVQKSMMAEKSSFEEIWISYESADCGETLSVDPTHERVGGDAET